MDIYKLSRKFWDFAFENPDKIKPNHIALYFFAIEHCNRLGWKVKFGLPTTMTMEAIGIKSYNTYINVFNDLLEFGFFILHEKSRNQYSSNVVALSNFDKANDKALDKAIIKHMTKQHQSTVQSTVQSNDSIDIQYTNIPITTLPTEKKEVVYKTYIADANEDIENFKETLKEVILKKPKSVELLMMDNKVYMDDENKNRLWIDFIKNAVKNTPQLKDEKHIYNCFKLFIQDNALKYQTPKRKYNFE